MYSILFTLTALAVALSTATPVGSPVWINLDGPSDLDKAFMSAGKSVRRQFPEHTPMDFTTYCHTRDNIEMDAGALPPVSPGLTLYHVALGRGTQNYSCPTSDPNAAPQTFGALATLYNVTCLQTPGNASIFTELFTRVNSAPVPVEGNPNESGHHYFTNGNSTATFNLHTPYITQNLGITFAAKIANVSAPATAQTGSDGSSAVPWLKLSSIGPVPKPAPPGTVDISVADQVGGVKEVYRLNTAGGAAPKTCAGLEGTSFQKQYSAEYWFWH